MIPVSTLALLKLVIIKFILTCDTIVGVKNFDENFQLGPIDNFFGFLDMFFFLVPIKNVIRLNRLPFEMVDLLAVRFFTLVIVIAFCKTRTL